MSTPTSETTSPFASRDSTPKRVVYLLGAGATHGSVKSSGGDTDLRMAGLLRDLVDGMKRLYSDGKAETDVLVGSFINDVVNDEADFEQLTTFLEDAPSAQHRRLAAQFKEIFFDVLQTKLEETTTELGGLHSGLYAALVDMHQVDGRTEDLHGFLTLNYDGFLEHAIETQLGLSVDYGVSVEPARPWQRPPIRVLKLHGSFTWSDAWPMTLAAAGESARWIPPGIRKAKGDYPFNAIWGLARELLDCDILRIVGCKLGENDWDLISLLFTTMHAHAAGRSYELEVIGRPRSAKEIQDRFPYLGAKSLLEIDGLGETIISEMLGGSPIRFDRLKEDQQRTVNELADSKIGNPFEYWLIQMGEAMTRDLGSIATESGQFEAFLSRR